MTTPQSHRLPHWEFWPSWLFYTPVAVCYTLLSARYGSATLPTCANPGFFTGGLIGESKFTILDALQRTSPSHTARTFLIPSGDDRSDILDRLLASGDLDYPFILKPDIGQRGSGFKVVHQPSDYRAYLFAMPSPAVAQPYVAGPHEAGLFYYRFPGSPRGRLLAITHKIFPHLEGDGRRTLQELILADPRAAVIAPTYLRRLANRLADIPSAGEKIRLVEAGNHAQGCIFQDGMETLWSERLEARVDEISRGVEGFFIGRYDVRYACPEKLRNDGEFTILELNGASSEATSAYDASKSLASCYALLFRQWSLVFQISAANRALGHRPSSAATILCELRRYRSLKSTHPAAD